jgi:ferrochelatase
MTQLKAEVSSDTLRAAWLYYDASLQTATLMAESTPRYGFVAFAETWNGRLAMLGFVIGLGTELLTGQSILSQVGLG